ncbi:phosphomannose isomerase type II C-terminal cupin domain [bacterium]|nr:phosphomannose isomerase type II C-terminal cupin domain [bacterium]
MKILFITQSADELTENSEFTNDFIQKLASEVNSREDFYAEILDISALDIKNLSIRDIEKLCSETKTDMKSFDALHTFSFLPFVNRAFFRQFVFYSFDFDLKEKYAGLIDNINGLNCSECDISNFSLDELCDFYEHRVVNTKSFDTRPWGWWKTLVNAEDYKIKHIFVAPHQKLSLQTHEFRSETWMIAEGGGFVVIGDRRFKAEKGLVFTIQKHEKHRAETEDSSMVIVELQLGSYLGEDDVRRIEDIYGRV